MLIANPSQLHQDRRSPHLDSEQSWNRQIDSESVGCIRNCPDACEIYTTNDHSLLRTPHVFHTPQLWRIHLSGRKPSAHDICSPQILDIPKRTEHCHSDDNQHVLSTCQLQHLLQEAANRSAKVHPQHNPAFGSARPGPVESQLAPVRHRAQPEEMICTWIPAAQTGKRMQRPHLPNATTPDQHPSEIRMLGRSHCGSNSLHCPPGLVRLSDAV
mmetsp:Transcript_1819/g.5310  ORF Transcript_1819/g.5310 Transcript_1819/m.5310 type:complete len:214 (-) Transcript_1819:23-664(-)